MHPTGFPGASTTRRRCGFGRRGVSNLSNGWAGLATAVACLLALASVAADDAEDLAGETPPAGSAVIDIQNVQFERVEIRVPMGTTVRWVNHDPFTHDVTSGISILGREARQVEKTKLPDGKFSSGLFGKDQTFSYTFDTKGEYPYYCNIHPFMVGKIVVE